jgi:hypothetical protein
MEGPGRENKLNRKVQAEIWAYAFYFETLPSILFEQKYTEFCTNLPLKQENFFNF